MNKQRLILPIALLVAGGVGYLALGPGEQAPATHTSAPTEAIDAPASQLDTFAEEAAPQEQSAASDVGTAETAANTAGSDELSTDEAAEQEDTQVVMDSGIASPQAPKPGPAAGQPMMRTPSPGNGPSATPVSLPPPPKS